MADIFRTTVVKSGADSATLVRPASRRPTPRIGASIRACALCCLVGAAAAFSQTAASPPRPADRLAAAGNGRILWLAVGEWDEQQRLFINYLFSRDAITGRTSAAASIPPQTGEMVRWAVVGDRFHVFFKDGAYFGYSKRRSRRELPLPGGSPPGGVLPLALAGEVTGERSRLWALVTAPTADAVRTRWEEQLRRESTRPASDERPVEQPPLPALDPVSALEPGRAYALVQYDGLAWQPGPAAPAECDKCDKAWLCADGQRIHLLWQREKDDPTIQYARYGEGRWEVGAALALPAPPAQAAVDLMNTQVVFAALAASGEASSGLECRQWSRPGASPVKEPWLELPGLQDAQGKKLDLPAGSTVGTFGDRLVLMRPGQPRAEVGFWLSATGGPPDQPFEMLPERPADRGPGTQQGLRDFASTLIVAAVLLLVLWRRQERIAVPVALPPGMAVAGVGKRLLAFLLDAAPAAAVVGWVWAEPLARWYEETMAAASAGERALPWPAAVYMATVWFRISYTAWCTVFEILMASTPGKRLFGTHVLSETLARPSILQIGIRNVSRLIELEPHLQIWPFLLVIFFTRNRQRVGDLLARTIVVEQQMPVAREVSDENVDEDERDGA